jgi:hypothetical protein
VRALPAFTRPPLPPRRANTPISRLACIDIAWTSLDANNNGTGACNAQRRARASFIATIDTIGRLYLPGACGIHSWRGQSRTGEQSPLTIQFLTDLPFRVTNATRGALRRSRREQFLRGRR